MRSRQIALKKFNPRKGNLAEASVAHCLKFSDRKRFFRSGSSIRALAQFWIRSSARFNAFPKLLKSVRIIPFGILPLFGCVTKTAYEIIWPPERELDPQSEERQMAFIFRHPGTP
jgi:hypothetical protein